MIAKKMWSQPFQLIDLHRIDDAHLRQRLWSGLMEFVLKHKMLRNFKVFLAILLPWLNEMELIEGGDFGKIILRYVLNDIDTIDKEIFVDKTYKILTKNMRGNTMTLAEQFRQEGLEQGLQKGRTEAAEAIAIKLLKKRMPVGVIEELTGLSAIPVANDF